jgi:hypothetical protein
MGIAGEGENACQTVRQCQKVKSQSLMAQKIDS